MDVFIGGNLAFVFCLTNKFKVKGTTQVVSVKDILPGLEMVLFPGHPHIPGKQQKATSL